MSTTALGNWAQCPICRAWDFVGRHRCAPLWEVRRAEDTDEEYERVYAANAEEAAEVFAHKTSQFSEYGRVEAEQRLVVRALGSDKALVCDVYGEVQPVYTVRPVKLPVEVSDR